MNNTLSIKINRRVLIHLYLIILSVMALSFLRPLLLILLPLFVIGFVFLFRVDYSKNIILLIGTIFLITLLSAWYGGEFNLNNYILSFYFIFPVLLIYFSRIKIKDKLQGSYFQYFIKILTTILIFNNCIGFMQYLTASFSDDDAFIGFYGRQGLAMHTLSLINFMICAYYFFLFSYYKTKLNLGLFIFFLLSAFLCFYGLGLIVFVVSIFLYKFSFRNIFKSISILILLMIFFGATLYLFRYQTFKYNYENIEKAKNFFNKNNDSKKAEVPRKLIMHKNYLQVYSNDLGLFLLGSGPGTFNSRTSFQLNGDYSRSGAFEKIFGVSTPTLASKYIYPLWESKMVSQDLYKKGIYNDGTRNEPFSSIISLLAEYGFFIFIFIFIIAYNRYKILVSRIKYSVLETEVRLQMYCSYIKFISIFMFLNLFTDNFLEYPEIIFVYVIIFKLIDMATTKLGHSSSELKDERLVSV